MIFVVTNRKLVKNEEFLSVIERVAKSKADYLILREKDLKYEELLSLAKKVKSITDKYNMPLIINGNLKVAQEIKAYGCQLGYTALKTLNLNINNLSMKIGASVHSIQEAKEVEKLGVHYIIAGHVFETDCKKGLKGRGLNFIKDISNSVQVPVIAIGGINKNNIKSVIQSGATGVAIMSSGMKENNIEIINNIKRVESSQ